jgi:hypothetical protein
MMQPRRANVGATVIAYCAEHAGLQVVEGHVIRKTADVQFGVVITIRIAASDEHMVSTETPHVGQSHGLVVEYKVRDGPGHSPSNCGTERASKPSYTLGLKIRAARQPNAA